MEAKGMFAGVRIVELAQYVFVPGATMLMADQGAEVIKIETPGVGDPYRSLKVGDGREVGAINLAMEQNNHSKKSLCLDLKNEEGREALLKLVETADVFITSLRPKAMRSLRLDVADLRARNPKLIYARGNGLGFKGAEADKAGFDSSTFWARSGMADAFTVPGQPAPSPRAAFGDHSGSLSLAYAISAALFKRAMTGEPTVVETSLLATAIWMLSSDVTYAQAPGYKVHATGGGNRMPLMKTYPTKDGRLIMLMLLDPRPHWGPLCRLLGLEELINDPRFVDNAARQANCDALAAILTDRIGSQTWAEWKPIFEAWDAPWELIRTIMDVKDDPQVLANEMIYNTVVDGTPLRLASGPVTFDGSAKPIGLAPAPGMGEHSRDLLASVGYSPAEIEDLMTRGVAE
jgi:crotonobetainyl-CoA:carnitine CoA-transferase CaiB-like acyl-CoA transferase